MRCAECFNDLVLSHKDQIIIIGDIIQRFVNCDHCGGTNVVAYTNARVVDWHKEEE